MPFGFTKQDGPPQLMNISQHCSVSILDMELRFIVVVAESVSCWDRARRGWTKTDSTWQAAGSACLSIHLKLSFRLSGSDEEGFCSGHASLCSSVSVHNAGSCSRSSDCRAWHSLVAETSAGVEERARGGTKKKEAPTKIYFQTKSSRRNVLSVYRDGREPMQY